MREHSGLLTDLYELTMAAGYVEHGFAGRATFELFVRHLPPRRSYLVAAGLEQALDYIAHVSFTSEEIAYLRGHPAFAQVGPRFFDFLASFRFHGDIWALPEGTIFFPGEPLLRVKAPIAEAQILETYLLSTLSFQTLIATKAARLYTAAQGRSVIEFGTRRAHSIGSGVLAARAAYIGGCQGTSNVYAGHAFGIPTYGTQAHSWIMAQESEAEAFRRFVELFPNHAVLLLDTYDVRAAVETILAAKLKPRAVRLDSGDLAADSIWVRRRLDAAGWQDVQVFASGDLDEDRVAELLARGAQIDGFGVGTALSTSSDAPALGVVYKLAEMEESGAVRVAAKFSHAKATYPGSKQVFRFADAQGKFARDVIALDDEHLPGGTPLLVQVMHAGQPTLPQEPLGRLRVRFLDSFQRLPEPLRRLDAAETYPVRHSARLEAMLGQVRERVSRASSRTTR